MRSNKDSRNRYEYNVFGRWMTPTRIRKLFGLSWTRIKGRFKNNWQWEDILFNTTSEPKLPKIIGERKDRRRAVPPSERRVGRVMHGRTLLRITAGQTKNTYPNQVRYDWQCDRGHTGSTRFMILKRYACKLCTYNNRIKESKKKYEGMKRGSYRCVEYISNTVFKAQCEGCGTIRTTSASEFLKGRMCLVCKKNNRPKYVGEKHHGRTITKLTSPNQNATKGTCFF